MSKHKQFETSAPVAEFDEVIHTTVEENLAPDGSQRNTPRPINLIDRVKLMGGFQTISGKTRAFNDKMLETIETLLHNRKSILASELPGFNLHHATIESVPGAMFYYFVLDEFALGYLVMPLNLSGIPEGCETSPFVIEKSAVIKEELTNKLGKRIDFVNSIVMFDQDLTEINAEKLVTRIWMCLTGEWEEQVAPQSRLSVRELMQGQWRVNPNTAEAIARYMEDSPSSLQPPCDFGFTLEYADAPRRQFNNGFNQFQPQAPVIWKPAISVLCQVNLVGPSPAHQNKWLPVVKITGISCSMLENPIFIFMGLACVYDQVQARRWTEPLLRPQDKGALNLGVIIPEDNHKLITLKNSDEAQEVISKWLIPTSDYSSAFGATGPLQNVPIILDLIPGYYRSSFLRYLSRPDLMQNSLELARQIINPHTAPLQNSGAMFTPYEKELVGTIGDDRAVRDSRNVTYLAWASQNGAMQHHIRAALTCQANPSTNRHRAEAIQNLTHSFRILSTNTAFTLIPCVGEWLVNLFNGAGFTLTYPTNQTFDPITMLCGGPQAVRFGGVGGGGGTFTSDI